MSTQGSNGSSRKNLVKCQNCGELYSDTYRDCPFCSEPVMRNDGQYTRRPAPSRKARTSMRETVLMALSVVLILVAFFLIFKSCAPLKKPTGSSFSGASSSVQKPPEVVIHSVTLDSIAFPLSSGGSASLTATVSGTATSSGVIWSSSDENVAVILGSGNTITVVNVNTGGAEKTAIITASCGDKTASCTVTCQGDGSDVPPQVDPKPQDPKPQDPVTPGNSGTTGSGKITGADSGVFIRKGPGKEYEAQDSLFTGDEIKVLENANGWAKIEYVGISGKKVTGYVSSAFVSVS